MSLRERCLSTLRDSVARGIPILGVGAGTGISAKFAEAGGADLIIIYNSGRYRMAGRGSLAGLLPYGDANQIVVEMASEVLPVVKFTRSLDQCGDARRVVYRAVIDAVAVNRSARSTRWPCSTSWRSWS